MNRILLIASLFFGFLGSAQQSFEVPYEVSQNLAAQFPNHSTVEWQHDFRGKDLENEVFVAHWIEKNKAFEIVFSKSGAVQVIEESIAFNELPKQAKQYLSKNYPSNHFDVASKVSDRKRLTYEVGIDRDGKFIDIQFDDTGYYLQTVEKNSN